MRHLSYRFIAYLLALSLFSPAAAWAQSPSPAETSAAETATDSAVSSESPAPIEIDNGAIAVNETDGASVFEYAFDVIRVTDGIVDQTNLALAYSSCEACTTVAVAIQIVLVIGEATVVTPENVAVAVNYECVSCETFAMAYQFVIGIAEGPIHITGAGQKALAALYREIRELWRALEEGSIEPLDFFARLGVLMDELGRVLAEEVVPAGKPAKEEEDDEAEHSPSPTPSETVEADPSATPQPSESPVGETTPEPTPSG